MNYTYWDIGSCNCIVNVQFSLIGCNNLGISAGTVNIYRSDNNALVGSGTTDSTGNTPLISLPASTYLYADYTGISSRLATQQGGPGYQFYFPLFGPYNSRIGFSGATGYTCQQFFSSSCVLPSSNTLYSTASSVISGSTALTFHGSGWSGTDSSGRYQTSVGLAGQVTVLDTQPGGSGYLLNAVSMTGTCPPSFLGQASSANFGVQITE